MAGPEAEARALDVADLDEEPSETVVKALFGYDGNDREIVMYHAMMHSSGPRDLRKRIDEVQSLAARLVKNEWKTIVNVAAALWQNKTVTGKEIRRMFKATRHTGGSVA